MIARATAATVAAGMVLVLAAGTVRADVFTMPAGQMSLDFVTVGDAGNQPDSRYASPGYGSVGYSYQMGKYDVTAAQYAQFLNAVATASDPYGLYNTNMANSPSTGPYSVGCGISRTSNAGVYTYSVTPGKENMPVNWVSWADALRFTNWLSNGQPTGAVGPGTTETGSYTLNGTTYDGIIRNPGATYVLPSENEWYKAAYYKGSSADAGYWTYPTRSDTVPSNSKSATGTNNANFKTWQHTMGGDVPVYTDPQNYLTPVGYFAGSPGPYGTFDMGGDVFQWLETVFPDSSSFAPTRGGSFSAVATYLQASTDPGHLLATEVSDSGFRIGLVPEPTAIAFLYLGGICFLKRWRRNP